MRVAIVPVTGCFTSGLSTLIDVLQTAEALRRSLDAQIPASRSRSSASPTPS